MISKVLNRLAVLGLGLFLLQIGCNGSGTPASLPPATTPEKATAAMTAALEAWKNSATPETLAAQSPPVYFLADDFRKGSKLQKYQIVGSPTVVGTGLTFVVELTLELSGKTTTKKVAYRVVTEPRTAITQEDQMP
ncbi:MAG: hypothetical protein ACRCZF_04565 [Gemmataceae bacterium]